MSAVRRKPRTDARAEVSDAELFAAIVEYRAEVSNTNAMSDDATSDAVHDRVDGIEESLLRRVLSIPAQTLAGIYAKMKLAADVGTFADDGAHPAGAEIDARLLVSAMNDAERQAAKAVRS